MKKIPEINFPAIRINENYVNVIHNKNEFLNTFSKVSGGQLKKGSFQNNVSIIDSNGNLYKLIAVKKIRKSYSLFDLFSPHPWYLISCEFSDPKTISFAEAKQLVRDLIIKKRWFSQGGESRNEFATRIDSASNFGELFDEMCFYGNKY